MALAIGARLGPYEILSALGAGGMGEVYRAWDTKLNRDVAIKVLPDQFVADPERVARFQREAKTLAALNHPHIGGIYGLEDADGVRALVLELVEGPTLADRIAQGPIPLDEALPIARQIAEALEAAHEAGIIHRDLKPANIKLRPDGTVKVLDFGLAKALESTSAASANVTASPTITTPAMMTGIGMILGTAAYMSPEQARGRMVDKRTDVWAFGCVAFEMLAGARAFDGEDIAETIGAIIHKEPSWETLPTETPPTLRLVLQRCLEKDPKRRVRDIGDVMLALDGAFTVPPSATTAAVPHSPHSKRRSLWLSAGAAASTAVLSVAATSWLVRTTPPPLQPARFTFAPPAAQPLNLQGFFRQIAISPDGTHIAYVAGADSQLMLRAIDQLDAV